MASARAMLVFIIGLSLLRLIWFIEVKELVRLEPTAFLNDDELFIVPDPTSATPVGLGLVGINVITEREPGQLVSLFRRNERKSVTQPLARFPKPRSAADAQRPVQTEFPKPVWKPVRECNDSSWWCPGARAGWSGLHLRVCPTARRLAAKNPGRFRINPTGFYFDNLLKEIRASWGCSVSRKSNTWQFLIGIGHQCGQLFNKVYSGHQLA